MNSRVYFLKPGARFSKVFGLDKVTYVCRRLQAQILIILKVIQSIQPSVKEAGL